MELYVHCISLFNLANTLKKLWKGLDGWAYIIFRLQLPSFQVESILLINPPTYLILTSYDGEPSRENGALPVKNVTCISSCLLRGSLVENETKSDGNTIMFFANAMEVP